MLNVVDDKAEHRHVCGMSVKYDVAQYENVSEQDGRPCLYTELPQEIVVTCCVGRL
jgi:hypothetical protein